MASSGITNLLLDTPLDPDQGELLNNIRVSADNLLMILNDVLDLAKIEAGRLVLQNVKFSPRTLFEDVIRVISPQINRREIALEYSIDASIPRNLMGDPHRLIQILLNIANNAIKFTRKGYIAIHAHLMMIESGKAKLEFIFSDTGIGIEKEHLPHLFRKFYQAPSAFRNGQTGSGLGLYLVKQLVDLHGGSIDVESRIGRGTKVTLLIPFALTVEDGAPGVRRKTAVGAQELKDRSVLVVEDNPINQMIARRTLMNWGAEVTLTTNGFDCLSAISTQRYDIVLLDIEMPGMNGYETAAAIRGLADPRVARIPIIAMTASAPDGMHERMQEVGINKVTLKPFNPGELLASILELIAVPATSPADSRSRQPIDLAYFRTVAGGDVDFFRESIRLAIQQVELLTDRLVKAHGVKDFSMLHQSAHQLKPIYKMVELGSCAELLDKISRTAKLDQATEDADAEVAFLQDEALWITGELNRALDTAATTGDTNA